MAIIPTVKVAIKSGKKLKDLLKLLKENNGDISIEDLYSKLRKDVGLSAIRNLNKIQTPSILVGKKLESQLSTRLLFENE